MPVYGHLPVYGQVMINVFLLCNFTLWNDTLLPGRNKAFFNKKKPFLRPTSVNGYWRRKGNFLSEDCSSMILGLKKVPYLNNLCAIVFIQSDSHYKKQLNKE